MNDSAKKEEIELLLSDSETFALMKIAHEQDITLNQLVERILIEAIEKTNE
jgi:predicted HicB family RNase H-like nuclease